MSWKDLPDTEAVMVCSPSTLKVPVEGSVRRQGSCGHEVWLAPTGQQIVAERGIEHLVCGDCFLAEADEREELLEQIQPMTPEQTGEIVRELIADRLRGYEGPLH